MLSFALVLFAAFCCSTEAFNFGQLGKRLHTRDMQMKIGRTVDEIGLSKRQMFQRVRDKLDEAAAVPGFFEVGEGTPVSPKSSCLRAYIGLPYMHIHTASIPIIAFWNMLVGN
ncbi:hypothetical protein EON63_06460 [archaeon]|nr:MAG: hypothetical protein EON63_06460 [archaeon]